MTFDTYEKTIKERAEDLLVRWERELEEAKTHTTEDLKLKAYQEGRINKLSTCMLDLYYLVLNPKEFEDL
jgi:hypothetical protein